MNNRPGLMATWTFDPHARPKYFARVTRARRAAKRQGFRLTTRDGGYMILGASTNAVVAGGHPTAYNLTLDEAEQFLNKPAGPRGGRQMTIAASAQLTRRR